MELVIRPEPPEDVRAAIVAALGATDRDGTESAWWRAGLDEAACAEPSPGGPAATGPYVTRS